jgi:hypothetical protein
MPVCVPDHKAQHRGVQALIGGNRLAHVGHSNLWRATPGGAGPEVILAGSSRTADTR